MCKQTALTCISNELSKLRNRERELDIELREIRARIFTYSDALAIIEAHIEDEK